MTEATPEPRYPLALTERQLKALTGYLDTVSTSEADPDAEVFALIDQVRQVRKQAATASAPLLIQIEQNNPQTLARARCEIRQIAIAKEPRLVGFWWDWCAGYLCALHNQELIDLDTKHLLDAEADRARDEWVAPADASRHEPT